MHIINTILDRMMSNPTFADAVFANAEKALEEYNLSTDEVAKFKSISRADFNSMTPEQRKSFSLDSTEGGWRTISGGGLR
ncbi:MAG TPA: Os1348 family NHLP clan protein [Anaerolineales bacterium]|nr:Os1348 family NHLP clan protein [Anaerolineales bacterium]